MNASEFVTYLLKNKPQLKPYTSIIEDFILKSKVENIEIRSLAGLGMCLHDKLVLNPSVFSQPIRNLLYTIFHEIAHQYQYKKYGVKKMYYFYRNDISASEAAVFMKEVELTADRLANLKLRQLSKAGLEIGKVDSTEGGAYKYISVNYFEDFIIKLREKLGTQDNDYKKISALLYNYFIR